MTLSEAAGEVKRFRRRSWKFQQTFKTSLKDLRSFVTTILATSVLKQGSATVEQVVFKPKHLLDLLASRSIPAQHCQSVTLTTTDKSEIAPLLEAALGDWADFLFVPVPASFVIYADHDEYVTFFANSRSSLNRVVSALTAKGFKDVPNYIRNL